MNLLLIAGPLAGAFAGEGAPAAWSLAYLMLAIACVVVALKLRHRGALIGGFVAAAIGVYGFRNLVAWPLQWKLIASGALMLGISAVISRALRSRSRGFVVTPIESAYEEALRVFGTAAFAPSIVGAQAEQHRGGGGEFGGAGATGEY